MSSYTGDNWGAAPLKKAKRKTTDASSTSAQKMKRQREDKPTAEEAEAIEARVIDAIDPRVHNFQELYSDVTQHLKGNNVGHWTWTATGLARRLNALYPAGNVDGFRPSLAMAIAMMACHKALAFSTADKFSKITREQDWHRWVDEELDKLEKTKTKKVKVEKDQKPAKTIKTEEPSGNVQRTSPTHSNSAAAGQNHHSNFMPSIECDDHDKRGAQPKRSMKTNQNRDSSTKRTKQVSGTVVPAMAQQRVFIYCHAGTQTDKAEEKEPGEGIFEMVREACQKALEEQVHKFQEKMASVIRTDTCQSTLQQSIQQAVSDEIRRREQELLGARGRIPEPQGRPFPIPPTSVTQQLMVPRREGYASMGTSFGSNHMHGPRFQVERREADSYLEERLGQWPGF